MDTCDVWRPLLVGALLLAALPAMATPPADAGRAAAVEAPPRTGDVGLGPALEVEALSSLRGGDGQVMVEVDNHGTVEGNTASQVIAGDNRIDGGAFANAAGLTTVIQNSGSNVLIQNGTSVNVRFGSGP